MSDGESETLNEITRYPESGRREALEPSRVGKIWQPDRVSILCKVTLRVTWGLDKRRFACPKRFRRCSNRSVYRLSTRAGRRWYPPCLFRLFQSALRYITNTMWQRLLNYNRFRPVFNLVFKHPHPAFVARGSLSGVWGLPEHWCVHLCILSIY